MRTPGGPSPFTALGLPARADLTDDEVRSAWRRIAAATHPDRADGGDPGRFAVAAAAYTVLRTRSGRGEALADLASPFPGFRWARSARARAPDASPSRPGRGSPAITPPGTPLLAGSPGTRWPERLGRVRLLSRIRRGRPARLALRVLIATAVGAVAVAADGVQPATSALITGVLTWLLLTGRHDLSS